jgi:SET domain-containing protein
VDGLPTFTPELEELTELEELSKHFSVTAPLMPGFDSSGEEHLHEEI